MGPSLVADGFDHHVWATLELIDACSELGPQQLATSVPGTYGSILDTMRHLVNGDATYLLGLTGDRAFAIETDGMDLRELRATIEHNGAAWSAFLGKEPDVGLMVKEIDEHDGYQRDASVGIRLAQALHHGTDHRSQVCTALTTLGIEPPPIDVWKFGVDTGRIVEVLPL
jgi:uncharacterized damage-inducible protein DinB